MCFYIISHIAHFCSFPLDGFVGWRNMASQVQNYFFLLPELFFQVPELWATSRRLVGEAGEVRVVTRVAMPVVHWFTFRFENLIFLSNINDKIGVFLSFIDDVFLRFRCQLPLR